MFSLREASATAREPEVAAALAAVDRYLEDASGPAKFRTARNSSDGAVDREAYAGLAALGVTAAIVPESQGGAGLAPAVGVLIAERLGHALAREPYIENALLPTSVGLGLASQPTLEAIAKGEIFCVAWQEGPFSRPDSSPLATQIRKEGKNLRLIGRKRFVMGARASAQMLVLAELDGHPALIRVAQSAPRVTRQDKFLADGTCWSDIDFDVLVSDIDVLAQGSVAISALCSAIDHANLAIAGMLYGLQTRILEVTLEYLGTRVQFDQPIGSFQALQHRAVDLYTHAQIARFLLGEAVDAADQSASILELYASRAKARASDAALRIAKEGIQMHGAIGFSDEYDLGLYVKRILVLSAWLGSADWHRRHLARVDPLGDGGLA